jgi:hypothetical protein
MILIDTVYQRVLAIANKEQRGYVTPLEFNLLANQASLDIFEQYFYDRSQSERVPGNSTAYSDVEHMLNEKIAVFAIEEGLTVVTGGHNLPIDLYILGSVIFTDPAGVQRECEEVSSAEFLRIRNYPLTAPTNRRPIYYRFRSPGLTSGIESGIRVFGDGGTLITTPIRCDYIKVPNKVEWGYDVVAEKALYNGNANRTFNFEHHPADETTLVMKILELAGVILQDPGVIQYADQEDLKKIQQKKA